MSRDELNNKMNKLIIIIFIILSFGLVSLILTARTTFDFILAIALLMFIAKEFWQYYKQYYKGIWNKYWKIIIRREPPIL